MLTINDILKVKKEMEDNSMIACSDEFISELRNLEDNLADAIAEELKNNQ